MRQQVTTEHVLETSDEFNTLWHCPVAGMFRQAVGLAHAGLIAEALRVAEQAQIDNYGNMDGVKFRVVSTVRMVTQNAAFSEFDD